jgi:DNA-binding XRE family transcriptional regulator
VPAEEEIDQHEDDSTHFVFYKDKIPTGAGRFRSVDGYGKVERICVLKEARKSKGLSQVEVMRLTNINNKTLSGYENGISEPDLETILILS